MKAHGRCGCKDAHRPTYIYTATALGKGRTRWLVLRSAAFTRGTHFIVGWVDPRSSLGIKDWRKFPPLRHPESNPGRRARSQAHCRLSHMTPLRKPWHQYNHLFPTLKKHIFSIMSPLWTNIFSSFCKTNIPAILLKNFFFEFENLRQYSGWEAITSALAFGPARLTTPLLQPLFALRKIVSVTYGLQAGVSSACRGEYNIPLLQTQRLLVSKFIKTQINVWKIPLK